MRSACVRNATSVPSLDRLMMALSGPKRGTGGCLPSACACIEAMCACAHIAHIMAAAAAAASVRLRAAGRSVRRGAMLSGTTCHLPGLRATCRHHATAQGLPGAPNAPALGWPLREHRVLLPACAAWPGAAPASLARRAEPPRGAGAVAPCTAHSRSHSCQGLGLAAPRGHLHWPKRQSQRAAPPTRSPALTTNGAERARASPAALLCCCGGSGSAAARWRDSTARAPRLHWPAPARYGPALLHCRG